VYRLTPSGTPQPGVPGKKTAPEAPISHSVLAQAQLTGEVGKAKRGFLRRGMDAFYSFFRSEPRNEDKRAKASGRGVAALEATASIADSIPGAEPVVEIASLIKQHLAARLERGF